jgi:hypothetical protein
MTERERQRERQTERERDRKRQSERQRETEKETLNLICFKKSTQVSFLPFLVFGSISDF